MGKVNYSFLRGRGGEGGRKRGRGRENVIGEKKREKERWERDTERKEEEEGEKGEGGMESEAF